MRVQIPLIVQSPVNGSAISGASVAVTRKRDGATSGFTYDSRSGGNSLAPPFVTDSFGRVQSGGNPVWIEQGSYDFTISGSGLSTYTVTREMVGGDGINETLPVGAIAAYAGFSDPPGHYICDGRSLSRSTDVLLFAALSIASSGTTSSGSATVTGIPSTALMGVGMKIEGTGIPGGATIASIVSSTSITLSATATASGTVALTVVPYGTPDNTGTSFLLPNLQQRFALGKSASGTGSVIGATGGVIDHSHGISSDGAHSHTGASGSTATTTDAQGTHSHGGGTGGAGNHTHSVTIGTLQRGNTNIATGGPYSEGIAFQVQNQSFGTTNPGDHSHGISLDGNHGHNVTAHTHSISSDGAHSHGGATGTANPPFQVVNFIVRHGRQ